MFISSRLARANKRIECKLDKDLVDRLDRAASLLDVTRTELIKTACSGSVSLVGVVGGLV